MKKLFLWFVCVLLGFGVAGWAISNYRNGAFDRERAAWAKEKDALQSALKEAQSRTGASAATTLVKQKEIQVGATPNPAEIIERLQHIKISSGPAQIKNTRLAIQQFENLIASGPSALPAIREFLLQNIDIDYDSSFGSKGSKEGKMAAEFILPPSLRFGLFDAVRQIGSSDAEKLLAEILATTGRGAEIAYLARALQEMAPNKYRDLSITAARDLLARPVAAGGSGLDKYDREYLYGVLTFYGDASYAAEAQTHLVHADGGVDRGALKYLQQTLGVQALPSIAQAYQDPNLDPSKREPLIRYALNFAGADAQATEFWRKAITDPSIPFDHRRELIEDLNQDGLENEKNPTPHDAQLVAKRLELIDQLYNEVENPALINAWHEAGKDLQKMGLKFLSQPESPYVLGQDSKPLRDALFKFSQPTP